jgi:photosystem II stability/assembly factor-like uncharacterized protein
VRKPERCILLDAAQAGNRLVAVGERGIVILSDDNGKTWRQAKVPTSVTLTSVRFPSPAKGWAAGHAGMILATEDGGETWERQLDGIVAAHLAIAAAKANSERLSPESEAGKRLLDAAQSLVDDGADKPFLDMYFKNEKEGIAVGAYGLVFHTKDEGRTWTPWMNRIDNPKGFHFYKVQMVGDTIYLVGEQGLFCRSKDAGESFDRIVTPYRGSFFTSAVSPSGDLLIAGLRGNAYWYDDQSGAFTQIEVPAPVSFSAAVTGPEGMMLFANQAGQIFKFCEKDKKLCPVDAPPLMQIASLNQLTDGTLITTSAGGIMQFPLTGSSAGKTGGAL